MTRPQRRSEREGLSLAEFLPYRLSIAAESVSRAFAHRYEERFGLSIPEWRVLAVLAEAGCIATAEIIARTQMDRVRVSRAVIRLADKNLVARAAKPGDQRAQILELTRRGRELHKAITPIAHEMEAALLTALTGEEQRALAKVLPKIIARARQLAPIE